MSNTFKQGCPEEGVAPSWKISLGKISKGGSREKSAEVYPSPLLENFVEKDLKGGPR
jgi:hypothetical protein